MKAEDISKYTIEEQISLVEAIKKIDANSMGLLYVINYEGKLMGCLTDGDVRRWLIKGGSLDSSVHDAMNNSPKYTFCTSYAENRRKMETEQIYSLAVVDHEKRIIDIVFHEAYLHGAGHGNASILKEYPIIIMAGGKGTRLYPYTKIIPKPLIPVTGVPILERIMDNFYSSGASEFFLTVNYKKEMIKSYFTDVNPPYRINFIEEPKPLGTAGSIRLIKARFTKPVIVTNCDILINIKYDSLIKYHIDNKNDITIVASLKKTLIPYGVLHTEDGGVITSMDEKPEFSFFVNTGMYVINPDCIKFIPENTEYHMTDLANSLISEKKKVAMYPIGENSFLDMGEFSEMKRMEEKLSTGIV